MVCIPCIRVYGVSGIHHICVCTRCLHGLHACLYVCTTLYVCMCNSFAASQAFYQGLSAPAPQHVGSVLTLAHFLDHMYHHRPAKRVEASPWYESATSLVQQLITETVQDAPKVPPDSQLQSSASMLASLVAVHDYMPACCMSRSCCTPCMGLHPPFFCKTPSSDSFRGLHGTFLLLILSQGSHCDH